MLSLKEIESGNVLEDSNLGTSIHGYKAFVTVDAELIADFACKTGEGPLWHAEHECLYWVDIPDGELYRFKPSSGKSELIFQADRQVGGFTIQVNGDLLLFMEGCQVLLVHEDEPTVLIEGVPGQETNRFNDVIAGPQGQVFCGTMSTPGEIKPDGLLYLLSPNGELTELMGGIGTSNGMGFSPDRNSFFHTDTKTGEVTKYPWLDAKGDFDRSRPEVWYSAAKEPASGRPDGMTIDAKGHLWIAHWDGSRIVHLDALGGIVESIQFPTLKVSSVTFGGQNLTDLYVTTAGGHDKKYNGETAGALYRLPGISQGLPEFRSQLVQSPA